MHRGSLHHLTAQLLVCASSLLYASSTHATDSKPMCDVQPGRINNIRLGGSIDQVFRTFEGNFEVSETKPREPEGPHIPRGPHTFDVREKSTREKWITFAVTNNNKILLAYVTGPCKTKKGIGPGSTLGQAIDAYGQPGLSPTDVGYYVGFRTLPRVGFLLDNSDIPKRLRGIPDDEVSPKEESDILKIHSARIVEIRLMANRIDD
jgi:hypothetical protein